MRLWICKGKYGRGDCFVMQKKKGKSYFKVSVSELEVRSRSKKRRKLSENLFYSPYRYYCFPIYTCKPKYFLEKDIIYVHELFGLFKRSKKIQ